MRIFLVLLTIFLNFLSSYSSAESYVRPVKKLSLPDKVGSVFDIQQYATKVLPPVLQKNETSDSLVTKIADNSIALYWEKSPLRQTAVGQVADAAEKKMKLEVDIKDQLNTDHKFSFKILAMQTLAKIEYSGWVKAALNYDLRGSKTEAEIIESISDRQDIVLSQSKTSDDVHSKISLRWLW